MNILPDIFFKRIMAEFKCMKLYELISHKEMAINFDNLYEDQCHDLFGPFTEDTVKISGLAYSVFGIHRHFENNMFCVYIISQYVDDVPII